MAKQAQTTRPKHIPQRTCIACRTVGAKRGLMRLVRLPEGRVAIDPTGKQAGRGAYLCRERGCWATAFKRKSIERALQLETLTAEDRAMLGTYHLTLPVDEPASERASADSQTD